LMASRYGLDSAIAVLRAALAGKQDALTFGNFTSSTAGISITNGPGAVIGTGTALNIAIANTTNTGLLSYPAFINFDSAYKYRISAITTLGSSGPASRIDNGFGYTLNLPQYAGGGGSVTNVS